MVLSESSATGVPYWPQAAALVWAVAHLLMVPQPVAARSGTPEVPVRLTAGQDAVSAIEEALAKARSHRADGAATIMRLPAGHFRLRRAIRLSTRDGGAWSKPLIIRGAGRDRTILDGAWPLQPQPDRTALPATRLLARLPAAARSRVQLYSLPPELPAPGPLAVTRFHAVVAANVAFEIFDPAGALEPARWPNDGWAEGGGHSAGPRALRLAAAAARTHLWGGERDLWVEGYLGHDWSFEAIAAASLREKGVVALTGPLPRYGLRPAFRVAVRHAAAELDSPGEWYFDRTSGLVAVWPRGPGPLSVSVAAGGVVMDGASHVRLQDVSIRHVRGDALRVTGGTDVLAERLDVRWAAGRGAVFVNARASGIVASRLTDLGEGGVTLAGGDRRLLVPARLFASDNRIERFSRLGRTYKAAIRLTGVGNKAVGNFIADGPHLAIDVQGNDHIIRLNEIADVVRETSDAGAIYTGRDITARGTVIEHNLLRDIRAMAGFEVKGVYLDDFASGFTVSENIFLRVDQPVFIGGGSDNTITGNIFVASSPAIHIDARGTTWAGGALSDPTGTLRQGFEAMPVTTGPWRLKYPTLAAFPFASYRVPARIVLEGNIVAAALPLRLEAPATRAVFTERTAPSFITIDGADAAGLAGSRSPSALLTVMARRLRAPYAIITVRRIPAHLLDRRSILKP